MAIQENSPLLCWADKPDIYLESPALTFIKSMPPVWDETIAFPDSKMGKFVVMARRSGRDWYVAVINGGDSNMEYSFKLDFLKEGEEYSATYSRDDMEKADSMVVEKGITAQKGQTIEMKMRPGGGFVGRFECKNRK
jgi:alpha-glucosidase